MDFTLHLTCFKEQEVMSLPFGFIVILKGVKEAWRYGLAAGLSFIENALQTISDKRDHSWLLDVDLISCFGRNLLLLLWGGLQSGTNGIVHASGSSCACCPLITTTSSQQAQNASAPTRNIKQAKDIKWLWKLWLDQQLLMGKYLLFSIIHKISEQFHWWQKKKSSKCSLGS